MKKVISMLLSLVMIISVFSLTQLNAFASQSTTVKFEQSEARTVLNMINSFRASSDAWYWNSDNATKTYVNSEPLHYDYTLEKIAMQRACELIYLYKHQRPNGSSVFDAYTQYGYSSTGKGENIANGYPEFSAAAGNNAWIMNIMKVKPTGALCLNRGLKQLELRMFTILTAKIIFTFG